MVEGKLSHVAKLLLLCAILIFVPLARAKGKQKEPKLEMVDSGSFAVYSSGQRVATETFSITRSQEGSVVSSKFKSAQGDNTAEQSSELELTPSVEIRRYEWKELSPEKMEAVVIPAEPFLTERYSVGPEDKLQTQNFLLPTSTAILDDYFFIHREVLAWKFLATVCRKENGPVQCPLNQKVLFGTLNPHERSSMPVSVQFTGKEKLTMRGAQQEYSRFLLSSEMGDWVFWLDDAFKLVRLKDNSGGTEVVRD